MRFHKLKANTWPPPTRPTTTDPSSQSSTDIRSYFRCSRLQGIVSPSALNRAWHSCNLLMLIEVE